MFKMKLDIEDDAKVSDLQAEDRKKNDSTEIAGTALFSLASAKAEPTASILIFF